MNHIDYLEELPTSAEYNQMREDTAWGQYSAQTTEKALSNSLFSICARQNGQLVGYGRVVGDGAIIFYIQDVIVLQEYQKTGIGSEIMGRILSYISSVAVKNSIVGLLSAVGKEGFYEKFGFIPRPTESYGKGMFFYWKPEMNIL